MSEQPGIARDDGDEVYLRERLRHEPTDLLLADTVTSDIIGAVWRRSIKLGLGTFLAFLAFQVVNGQFFGSSFSRRSDDGSTFLIVGLVLGVLVFATTWLVFLNSERQEAISEWYTLLPGKSAAADSVYSHVAGALRDRQMPVTNYVAARTPTAYGATGNTLVLVDGQHYVYVSVFSYGTSLYLGWAMWRIRKGSALIRTARVTDANSVSMVLGLERLKAMREAVHAVCREALHTAIEGTTVSQEYGFPAGLPALESLPFGNAPQAGR
ncbi:hypothetical protein [Actinokineospora diospyrosa]|uniref:DUF304 domain-containing protein n=1 Tax=Actinokineospora diospyrosa TaxID=103728 RepID=A0ABT1IFW1_9PSEU|nr:hypothetical protein [Actinokineospora diospyrosa]MCP2271527.1 hypothetical protein [Actinokineospora diospyrosa]